MTSRLYGQDLLDLSSLDPKLFQEILDTALRLKEEARQGIFDRPLAGKAVAVILQKPSLRTRVSFEVAIARLGAHPVIMTGENSAFSRGETVKDTAHVLDGFVDAVVIRTSSDAFLAEYAQEARVPVINALTDGHHPCQGLADFLTLREHFGSLDGKTLAFMGDGANNMAHTLMMAGALAGMHVRVGTPPQAQPDPRVIAWTQATAASTGGSLTVTDDPVAAVSGADVVVTDTFTSMGQEAEHDKRLALFSPYCVDQALFSQADSAAVFLHCLPAHRGEETVEAVIDGPASLIYPEAENRLYAQQALLALILKG